MTVLCVPALEEDPWPSLGGQVCDFIEENLVYGPGDLRGDSARVSVEQRAFIYRAYEVYPRRHPQAGRRRFKRVGLSLRKGTAKTEFGSWVAACELHPDAPVRTAGWGVRGDPGQPVGGGVRSPYIPLVAYTEEQSEDLAYGTLKAVLEEGPLAADFDIGLERIMRRAGDGKAVALASAPSARDGALTTFQLFDETHWWVLPRLVQAHRTMLANTAKRKIADAWSLETTTAPEPGLGSVAERTMEYARQVAEGKHKDARLFYFHRQASDEHDLATEKGRRAAVVEASGPTAEWSDIESILEQGRDPTTDMAYWARVWCNMLVKGSSQAFDVEAWRQLLKEGYEVAPGSLVTLGFDGARYEDATALIGCEVATGYEWVIGIWPKPVGLTEWTVPEDQVDAAMTAAFETWNVWRLYADPYWWEGWLAVWAGRWGEKVVKWETNRPRQMGHAVRNFADAILSGEISHDGNATLTNHLGNARRRPTNYKDAEGQALWVVTKERSDSPHKIDGAMGAILAWEARTDAIAAGATGAPIEWSAV